jgi:hypothetical protein
MHAHKLLLYHSPIVKYLKRSMSITPTCAKHAAKRSGLWFAQAATSSPPLLPPCISDQILHTRCHIVAIWDTGMHSTKLELCFCPVQQYHHAGQ